LEQVRSSDGEVRLASVDKEGDILYETPGRWKCRKCGGVFVSVVSPPVLCGCCNRVTVCDSVTSPVFVEPWRPYGEPVIFCDIDLLFPRVAEFVKDHLVLRNDEEAILVALWIIASYKQDCFNTAPYLQFLGSIESGKTRALEVLGLLAFHAVNYISISPAALCREIERRKLTVLLDQAEMKFNMKSERGCEMYDIFMSGYKKGQKYVVCSMEDEQGTISRNVFGFKAVASTRVFDEAFASRSIPFHMKQGVPKVQDVGIDTVRRADELRNMLLYYGLNPTPLPLIDLPMTGRRRELFYPLFQVGKNFDIEMDIVSEFIEKDKQQMAGEMSDTIDADILREIQMVLHMIDEHEKIRLKDIAQRLEVPPVQVGYRLKAMNVKRKHGCDGTYIDLTDKETINELSYLFIKYHINGD